MFSPDASTLDRAATLRHTNPRRRQRTSSSDSLAVRSNQPKRRKRSALADNTFEAPANASSEQRHRDEKTNGGATTTTGPAAPRLRKASSGSLSGPGQSFGAMTRYGSAGGSGSYKHTIMDNTGSNDGASNLAVRSKVGGSGRRASGKTKPSSSSGGGGGGGDGGVELARTEHYTLTRERDSLPPQLVDVLGSEAWHLRLCPDLGYAVAFTAGGRAIVWRYGHTRSSAAGGDAGVYEIKLPAGLTGTGGGSGGGKGPDAFESLPVGTLVHDAGAGDLALLAVLPGGKVVYYESVRTAAGSDAAKIRGQAGVPLTGSLGGVFSGENITRVSDAEPDGFLLATSTGRLIHLSVRDQQGRPIMTSQYLEAPSAKGSGIFGSVRKALSFGGSGKDIVNISPVPGRGRSHKEVIVASAKCTAQLWNIARHGPKTTENEWDLKSTLVEACQSLTSQVTLQTPTLLDLVLAPTAKDASKLEHKVMALVYFAASGSHMYFLVGMNLQDGAVDVDLAHEIRSYDGPQMTPDLHGKKSKPTLLVPEPGHTAFVVFDTKIVLVSLTRLEDTPDSQLHMEAQDIADNYEECLIFTRKLPYHVVGCTVEPADGRSDRATCDIMVHGFGHIRIATVAAAADEIKAQRRAKAAKSKLEQVVFYGSMPDNLLDFRNEASWKGISIEEVQEAVITIVKSILDSTSPFVPTLSPSMEQQLKLRSQAIFDLNKFVQRWDLPLSTRWELLWSAEKFAAARAVFNVYNASLAGRQPGQKLLLEEALDMIPETNKHENDPEKGETDIVRHYLTRDIDDFDDVIPWAQQAIDELYTEGIEAPEEQAPLISQAADIQISALDAALKYREDHAEIFGLGKDMVVNGIFQGDYSTMPGEPWTSQLRTCDKLKLMFDLTKQMALKLDSLNPDEANFKEELITKLAEDSPKLTDVDFRAWEERCRWLESKPGEKAQEIAAMHRNVYKSYRKVMLKDLIELGAQTAAADLAEKYQDMDNVAQVTSLIHEQGDTLLGDPDPDERETGMSMLQEVQAKEDSLFDAYGIRWADAFYARQVELNRSARMLTVFPHRQRYLTEYLRKTAKEDTRYYKIAWINEVRGEKEYQRASDQLVHAERAETRLWAKQVQLSLAKLARLAGVEKGQIDSTMAARETKKLDQRLQITRLQQKLYDYVRPVLHSAIDDVAELQLAMQSFGGYVQGKETLAELLRKNLEKLVRRQVIGVEELIDTLSLMSEGSGTSNGVGGNYEGLTFADKRFYSALWLLNMSGLPRFDAYRATLSERCVWRRCILQDDWAALNRTEGKDEEAVMREARGTSLYKTLRAGFEDGLLNAHPPLDPRALSPAGESLAQLRQSPRYEKHSDAYLSKLANDLAAEDAALEEAMTKGRLDMWWKGVVEAARADVRGEQDAFGRLMAFKEEERRKVESAMREEREREKERMAELTAEREERLQEPLEDGGNGAMGFDGTVEVEGAPQQQQEEDAGSMVAETDDKENREAESTPTKKGKKKGKRAKSKKKIEDKARDAEGDAAME